MPLAATVLVVADEPDMREILAHHLSRAGFVVRSSGAGLEPRELRHRTPPDLVVLDLMHPGIDARELCRQLRAEGGITLLPIIVIPSWDEEADVPEHPRPALDTCLKRPVRAHELVAHVKAVLQTTPPASA